MISIFDSHTEAALAAAELIAEHVAAGPETNVALSGGSTPETAYTALADLGVDWERVTLWLGDERWVPADHHDSNTAMVRATLGEGAARLVAPSYAIGDPEESAAAYAVTLEATFAATGDRPDLVLLGMGDDGHTASLFPGTSALAARGRAYVANWLPDPQVWRLTATFPLLQSARHIVFLVTGSGKAEILRRILVDDDPYPAGLVARQAEQVTWILDEAAAALLG